MNSLPTMARSGFARGFITAAISAAALAVLLGAQQGIPGNSATPGTPGMNTPWGQSGPAPQGAHFFVTGDNTWGTLWRLDPGSKALVFVSHTKVDFPTSTVDPRR